MVTEWEAGAVPGRGRSQGMRWPLEAGRGQDVDPPHPRGPCRNAALLEP